MMETSSGDGDSRDRRFAGASIMRPPRFRLRTLFDAVALIALAVGWRADKVRRQRLAVAAIKSRGGSVLFDDQRIRATRPSVPRWLERSVGRHYFHEVVWADFEGTDLTDAGLSALAGLEGLQGLALSGTRITDAGLVSLRRLARLRRLYLDQTRIGDAGLVQLEGLEELEELDLHDTRVTDDGITRLQRALPRVKIER
jgi:hypothetical protein